MCNLVSLTHAYGPQIVCNFTAVLWRILTAYIFCGKGPQNCLQYHLCNMENLDCLHLCGKRSLNFPQYIRSSYNSRSLQVFGRPRGLWLRQAPYLISCESNLRSVSIKSVRCAARNRQLILFGLSISMSHIFPLSVVYAIKL